MRALFLSLSLHAQPCNPRGLSFSRRSNLPASIEACDYVSLRSPRIPRTARARSMRLCSAMRARPPCERTPVCERNFEIVYSRVTEAHPTVNSDGIPMYDCTIPWSLDILLSCPVPSNRSYPVTNNLVEHTQRAHVHACATKFNDTSARVPRVKTLEIKMSAIGGKMSRGKKKKKNVSRSLRKKNFTRGLASERELDNKHVTLKSAVGLTSLSASGPTPIPRKNFPTTRRIIGFYAATLFICL